MHWIFPLLKAAHLPFNVLVIDELSKFKNHTAKRFKQLAKYITRFPRRVGLTGTPIPRSLLNVFSQAFLIDGGKSFGPYVTHFRDRYFYQDRYRKYHWELLPGAEHEIQQKITSFAMRIDADDHLDVPPIIYNPIEFDLPRKAAKIYKDLRTKMFAEIDGQQKLIHTASAKYAALRQLVNGQLLDPEATPREKEPIWIHDEKIKVLLDLLNELQGKPLLVAYHYRADFGQLRVKLKQTLKQDIPYIGAGVSRQETERIINNWNLGLYRVLLGQPMSMGHGLNLQIGGHDIAWFGPTDDYEAFDQFNDRVHRSGVTASVRVHLLLARNTIDWVIRDRLLDKEQRQKSLLDMLKEYQRRTLWQ
jgi:SNF2 family DNA or RNA helicase